MKMTKISIIIIGLILGLTLISGSVEKSLPLGELGYEIADSLGVIMNQYSQSYPPKFQDPRRLAMLRAKSNDTIYGSSWKFVGPMFGLPHSYVFWTGEDTISFSGAEASPPFASSFPDEKTAVRNTKIALSGAQYNPDELGYFVYYVIILKDGKFTIKSGVGNEKREYDVTYY